MPPMYQDNTDIREWPERIQYRLKLHYTLKRKEVSQSSNAS